MSTRKKALIPAQSTTGATSTPTTVKSTVKTQQAAAVCPAAPRRSPAMGHQTHGAFTPLTGPITNVSQLMNGGRNIAKGSAGSFETLGEYSTYLKGLSLHDLHRHAVEDARIVPIDDRDRLIRRLETEWTSTASRYPGRNPANNKIPQRAPFTAAQMEAQAELRRKALRQT
jgi:hypothetical protein